MPRPTRLSLLALVAVLAGAGVQPAWSLDREREPTQYRRTTWSEEQGLPNNSVLALAQTTDGYLWVGTEEGLVRFDGVKFTQFTRANTPALAHSRVDAMTVAPDGTLLISTLTGLTGYRDGGFFKISDPRVHNRPARFVVGRDGTVWVITLAGLARLAGDRIEYVDALGTVHGSDVQHVAFDAGGATWIATARGLVRMQGERAEAIDTGALLDRTTVTALYPARDGSLWMGTGRALSRYADGRWTTMLSRGTHGDLAVEALHEDAHGPLWVATMSGLYRYRNEKFEPFDHDNEDHRGVRALLEDREDNLWVGRYGRGLERFTKGIAVPFGRAEGLDGGVRPILESRGGGFWIGLTKGGIRRFENGRFTPLAADRPLPDSAVRSLDEAADGTLWIGTDTAGVLSYRDGRLQHYTTAQGLSHNHARGLAAARDGTVWAATLGGLDRIRNGKVHPVALPQIDQAGVLSVYESRDGAIWIGTRTGLILRLVDDMVTPLPAADMGGTPIQSFLDDGEGNVWVGSYGSGIGRFRNGVFHRYTTRDGLFNDVAFQIVDDRRGRLWITANAGIYVVRKADLDAFDAGRIAQIPSRQIGTSDGMRSRECNGGDPAGIRDSSGRLWFPTIAGLVVIDPRHLAEQPRPLDVIVEHSSVIERDRRSAEAFDLWKLDDLEFNFTSPAFTAPERVRFRYQLEGFDSEWRDAGSRRTAFYTNIPAGEYAFRVQAAYIGDPWPEHDTRMAVNLPPRFYQTRWFFALCAVLALAAAGSAQGLRVRMTEQRRTQEAIRRSEERFRALVENSSDGVMLMRADHTIEYASPSTRRVLGYEPAVLHGIPFFDIVHPEDRATVAEYWRDAASHPGKPVIGVARVKHADGGWRYVEGLGMSRFHEPAVSALVLNYRDVTFRTQQEAELHAAKDAAESSNRAKTEFLANVSHEIRTPMNGILGMTHLALEAKSATEQREYLELVKTSGQALLVLINDILDLSKIEAGKLELEHIAFDLAPLVNDVVKSMAWRASEKGLTLSATIAEAVPAIVAGDPTRLRQVLVNLLGNALKFTERGSVSLHVSAVEASSDHALLQFSVTDTGIGIPEDKQQIIFEKFTQADGSTSRKYGGSGLGLSICQHVVQLMGGRMWIDSSHGAGSTFHFTVHLGRAQGVETMPPLTTAPEVKRRLSVLLAEDNPVNRLLAVRLLERMGHRVATANHGREAVERLERESFDVVLMDVQMPELNGFEATAVIREREHGASRHQFIAAMTAHALKGDRERCLEAGMDSYLSKPIDREALSAVLAEAVEHLDRVGALT
jgi:PAS domain S-box-containing protein